MKVLLVSPNGLQELSGGGLYLRSIAQSLCNSPAITELTILSKDVGRRDAFDVSGKCRAVYLRKNAWRDVLARVALCPTYLRTYRSNIAAYATNADVIMFHNSRCGGLMRHVRRKVPDSTYAILSDNVEAELKRQHVETNMLRKVTSGLETWIIRRTEALAPTADLMTFITAADRTLFTEIYGAPRRDGVLPIALSRGDIGAAGDVIERGAPAIVLFTAHFGFAPNKKALENFAEVARRFQLTSPLHVEFVVAGAKAAEAAAGYPDIRVVDSPSPDLMAATLASASAYLAPVDWGSGMKTKVAEAMSYGLPVICMPNAAVGYEAVLSDPRFRDTVRVVDGISSMVEVLHNFLQTPDLRPSREKVLDAFDTLYSYASQTRRLENLLLAR